jgi:hypothetical protein
VVEVHRDQQIYLKILIPASGSLKPSGTPLWANEVLHQQCRADDEGRGQGELHGDEGLARGVAPSVRGASRLLEGVAHVCGWRLRGRSLYPSA